MKNYFNYDVIFKMLVIMYPNGRENQLIEKIMIKNYIIEKMCLNNNVH